MTHDDMAILRRKLEERPPTITEFLEERLRDAELAIKRLDPIFDEPVLINMKALIIGIRGAIRIHSQWPVLVQTEPKMKPNLIDDYDYANALTMRMTQEIAWLTQEEYVKKFGTVPPTAPILKEMARSWQNHQDFNPEWLN